MNKAKEKTLDFVERQMVKEKEKFNDGMKNNYYQWEELFNELWREWVENDK